MKKKRQEFYSALDALDRAESDPDVGISFKVKESFRIKANIASQILGKPVMQICIESLERAISDAGLAA